MSWDSPARKAGKGLFGKWPRFKHAYAGKWAWHLHHKVAVEMVNSKGIMDRVDYIIDNKGGDSVDVRLSLIRICKQQRRLNKLHEMWAANSSWNTKEVRKIKAEIMRMHRKECRHNCPFQRNLNDTLTSQFSPVGNILTRYRSKDDKFVLKGMGGARW